MDVADSTGGPVERGSIVTRKYGKGECESVSKQRGVRGCNTKGGGRGRSRVSNIWVSV